MIGVPKPTRRPKRRGHPDPVSPEFRNYIGARDGQCVLKTLDREHRCRDAFGDDIASFGWWELHHIEVTGFGKRGPNEKWNAVRLCPWGHREVTENARKWRPRLRRYAYEVEGKAA